MNYKTMIVDLHLRTIEQPLLINSLLYVRLRIVIYLTLGYIR